MSHSLTMISTVGLLRMICGQCNVCKGFNPTTGGPHPPFVEFKAIWDTGATGSVITQAVVDRCGLAPIGVTQVNGIHGSKQSEKYLVNIGLPNGVGFAGIQVTRGTMLGVDVLIGMDIITKGDFAITNKDGKTTFSFRIPSEKTIDYVKEHNQIMTQRAAFAPQNASGKGKRGKYHNKH